MSSTSNITISLQSSAPSKTQSTDKSSKNSELDTGERDGGFDKALEKAQSDQATNTGKELPREDAMREERPVVDDKIQVDLNAVQTRKAGKLNLVTATENFSQVSDESLIAFMQDQGFSRADMAQLLIANREVSDVPPTAAWLKLKGDIPSASHLEGYSIDAMPEVVSEEAHSEEVLPTNLAEAIAAQLVEPKNPVKSSAILEVLAIKNVSQQLKAQLGSETTDQMTIKLTDLLPSLTKKPVGGGASNQGGSPDSGSFSSNQLDGKSLAELSKSPEMREFREFLAEHLKRAESLRELTDKLGTMVARQIAGQIGRGRWSLEIAMHPAELGSIEIEMEMTERGLEASFRASHSATRDLLMESMPRLKSWFEEGGIDVAYAGLTQDSGAQNGGNSTGEQNDQSEVQVTESEESSDLTDNQLFSDDSTGLDIRV
ncbi:MAG: flagellar hook-length control protein FliK [Gammaproteobacteria bacterium]